MGFFSRTLSRLDELKRVLTRDPASRQFLALADEYRRQGKHKEAIEVLQGGLAQNPSAVAGHVALGRLLQQSGRLDEALVSFHAALKLDPQNLVALRQTADLHLSRGDKVEAIKKLKLFRGLSPGERDVNELIRQLDDELAAASSGRPLVREEPVSPPLPAPEFRTGPVSRTGSTAGAPAVSSRRPRRRLACPRSLLSRRVGGARRQVSSPRQPRPMFTGRPRGWRQSGPRESDGGSAPAAIEVPSRSGICRRSPAVGSMVSPASTEPSALSGVLYGSEASASQGRPVGRVRRRRVSVRRRRHRSRSSRKRRASLRQRRRSPTLLRAQGHLADAGKAYRELARSEPDPERARTLPRRRAGDLRLPRRNGPRAARGVGGALLEKPRRS